MLSWNVARETSSFGDAITFLEHQAASDFVIGCLQEGPFKGKTLRSEVARLSSELAAIDCGAKAQLVFSRSLRLVTVRTDRTKRAVIARFRTPNGSVLSVVGVHFHDRTALAEPEARGGAYALLRRNLDEDLVDHALPLVVMGDFNAEPSSNEITNPFCLYARTPTHEVVGRHERATGVHRPALHVVVPRGKGTFFYTRNESWQTFDFMLVNSMLLNRLTATVCTSILGKTLVTRGRKATPRGGVGSDHLPVLAEMHFQ